jgi:hypothetical protein
MARNCGPWLIGSVLSDEKPNTLLAQCTVWAEALKVMKAINRATVFFITNETKYLVFTFLLCESESNANLLDYQKNEGFRERKRFYLWKYIL